MDLFKHSLKVGDEFRLIGRAEWFTVTKCYLAADHIPAVIGQNDRHQTHARVVDTLPANCIVMATAHQRKNGGVYRTRAYAVTTLGVVCTRVIAMDDTQQQAERLAVEYVKEAFTRDGIEPPAHIINRGKLAGNVVDDYAF